MTEEEKKAIEEILVETIHSYEEYYKGTESILPQISKDYKNANIILNLINKQQKELDLKDKEIKNLDEKFRYAVPDDMINELYVSKDKIKELKQKLLEEGNNLTEEQRQTETEFRQGKLKAYEDLLKE